MAAIVKNTGLAVSCRLMLPKPLPERLTLSETDPYEDLGWVRGVRGAGRDFMSHTSFSYVLIFILVFSYYTPYTRPI